MAPAQAKQGATEPPRKQGKQSKRPASAALPEGAEYDRVEEECVAQTAEAAYLLNGTGKVRQMLLVLRLDGLRAAVPKLHALLGTA